MKKIKFLFILFIIIFIGGCSAFNNGSYSRKSSGYLSCVLDTANEDNTVMSSLYEAKYENDIVTMVSTTEKIFSNDINVLEEYKEYMEKNYLDNSNKYGGYTFSIDINNNILTSFVDIDYTAINMEKFINDSEELKNYVNENNELTIDGVKSIYESMGAICSFN